MSAIQKGQQPVSKRTGTPAPRGSMGAVTTAASKGMALNGSANNNIANMSDKVYGKQGGTRPITPGTKAPTGPMGNVTKNRN